MASKDNDPDLPTPSPDQPAGQQGLPDRADEQPAGTHMTASEEFELDASEEEVVAEIAEAVRLGEMTMVKQIVRRAYHSGPIPSPSDLQNYDLILPGLANRLVVLTENEQKIRGGETKHIHWNDTFKVAASIIVSLAMVGGGVYCTSIGQPVAGIAIATSGVIAGVIGAFFEKSKRGQKDGW